MNNIDQRVKGVSPGGALAEIAQAIPEETKKNMVIVGSLAVGQWYFGKDGKMAVRTKDADCMLSPHIEAVPAGQAITEQLMDARWTYRADSKRPNPGTADTPLDELPAVRLEPPGNTGWFLELLTVPKTSQERERKWQRVETSHGHFGLPSFGFLTLTNHRPEMTEHGIRIARPEMMALANLLEHPELGMIKMSGGFGGRPDVYRSSKDLGRVVAIARLATGEAEDAVEKWPEAWKEALVTHFGEEWRSLARRAGDGLRALMADEARFEEAHFTVTAGLLVEQPPTLGAFRATARRVVSDAIEPLERMATE